MRILPACLVALVCLSARLASAGDLRRLAAPADARDVIACLVDIWIDEMRRAPRDSGARWSEISIRAADPPDLAEPETFAPETTAEIRAQGIAIRCRHQTARSYAATIRNPVYDPGRIAGTLTTDYAVGHCDYGSPTRLRGAIVVPYGCWRERVVPPFLIDGRRFCKPALETFYRAARFERRDGRWIYRGSLETASGELSAMPCRDGR